MWCVCCIALGHNHGMEVDMAPRRLSSDQYRRFLSMVAMQCGCRLSRFDADSGTARLSGTRSALRHCRARLRTVADRRRASSAALLPPEDAFYPLA